MLRRMMTAIPVLLLVSAACGGVAEEGTTTAVDDTTTTDATTTTEADTTTTEAETTTTQATTTTASEAEGAIVATTDSDLGTIVVDGEGNTLYVLTADSPGESTCQDQCAQAWPPFTTDGDPQAQDQGNASLVDTITRADGSTQVTYGGWPLYHFSGDGAAGDANGQGIESFGGIWWVIGPDGEPIEGS